MPDLLRGLRASDPAVAEQALKDLFASTTHQGTCYPATAPTVRFRAELAAAPGTPNRHHILLLAYAAVGPVKICRRGRRWLGRQGRWPRLMM